MLRDHPIIHNLEMTGYPDGKEQELPHCPCCGKECETVYLIDGTIVGCDNCVEVDSADNHDELFMQEMGP